MTQGTSDEHFSLHRMLASSWAGSQYGPQRHDAFSDSLILLARFIDHCDIMADEEKIPPQKSCKRLSGLQLTPITWIDIW